MTYVSYSDPTEVAGTAHVARNRILTLIGARDPRLDFFRGLAMMIILIAHTPNNPWTLWIPARFGWSDATEIFVFCSGMASALAFGKSFRVQGWALGTLRVAYRMWQVYWAHIGLFFVLAATMVALNASGALATDYVNQLNLERFFETTQAHLLGLMTLTYVPNYFDVLPMYIVALALMPLVIAAARLSLWAALVLVVGIWLVAQLGFGLPAEPLEDREWFFNPFGWQLIFFTGFAFMSGWLPAPVIRRDLIWTAAVFLGLSAIGALWWARFYPDPATTELTAWQQGLHWLDTQTVALRNAIAPAIQKTDFGVVRYLHFLALAYLAWILVGPRGARLLPTGVGVLSQAWGYALTATLKIGQQSLAIFVFSMWYARVQGVVLDEFGRGILVTTIVNITGIAMLIAVAFLTGWIKTHPWRVRAQRS